ncbi:putative early growth response protein 1-like [Apostichopus japonicus]|uniref:Putative early growth response protein 1-like n=1 Tax=Stichopus japonicus TaxID=307972 RepID=A0A2G8KBI3_STIJA|nr:putative early growth response protein 1-like [Apostichopus japonicus]
MEDIFYTSFELERERFNSISEDDISSCDSLGSDGCSDVASSVSSSPSLSISSSRDEIYLDYLFSQGLVDTTDGKSNDGIADWMSYPSSDEQVELVESMPGEKEERLEFHLMSDPFLGKTDELVGSTFPSSAKIPADEDLVLQSHSTIETSTDSFLNVNEWKSEDVTMLYDTLEISDNLSVTTEKPRTIGLHIKGQLPIKMSVLSEIEKGVSVLPLDTSVIKSRTSSSSSASFIQQNSNVIKKPKLVTHDQHLLVKASSKKTTGASPGATPASSHSTQRGNVLPPSGVRITHIPMTKSIAFPTGNGQALIQSVNGHFQFVANLEAAGSYNAGNVEHRIAGELPGQPATITVPRARTQHKVADELKIHKCTYPNCGKMYSKSSHLKAHLRRPLGRNRSSVIGQGVNGGSRGRTSWHVTNVLILVSNLINVQFVTSDSPARIIFRNISKFTANGVPRSCRGASHQVTVR